MNIYGRLSFLADNLKFVALGSRNATDKSIPPIPETTNELYSGVAGRFAGLELLTADGHHRNLYGVDFQPIDFSAEDLSFLRSGRNLLSTVPCGKPALCIFLSRLLDVEHPEQGMVSGEIRPSYLWDVENARESVTLCVLNHSGETLFCSGETPDRFPKSITESSSGEFEWKVGPHEYLASYWNLPMQSSFFVTHWTIVSSRTKRISVAPLSRFRISFLLVFLLAVWIVVLLSLVQIRRYLGPLGKLQEGTKSIASGDFQTRVVIKSGDEFEDLATSFNSMAGQIETQVEDLKQLQWGTLTALARTIDAKSPWTLGHSERVTETAVKIAQAMDLPPGELDVIRRGGLLHDIGKIGTPASILEKPGKLTNEEMSIMREHVNAGARILEPIPGLAETMPIVLQHHEWVNGGGYPNGIAGDEITLHARIFAVADCFDAMISDRPYRAGMPLERVMQIIQEGAAKQFDPRVVQVLQEIQDQERVERDSKHRLASMVGVG